MKYYSLNLCRCSLKENSLISVVSKQNSKLTAYIFINAIEFHFEEDDDQNKEREITTTSIYKHLPIVKLTLNVRLF